MSEKSGVFICPACRAVVRSDKPLSGGVVCGECQHEFGETAAAAVELPKGAKVAIMPRGRSQGGARSQVGSGSVVRDLTAKKAQPVNLPAMDELPPVAESAPEPQASLAENGEQEEVMPDGSVRVKRRKKRQKKEQNKGLILFLAGWLSVIVIIFALFKVGKMSKKAEPKDAEVSQQEQRALRHRLIISELLPEISKNTKSFLSHPTLSGREQYIDQSADLSLPFARFYKNRPFPKPETQIRLSGSNVLDFSEGEFAIETVWSDSEGHRWGAVHVWDGSAWKLDWENFAPLSSEPWSRFRAELGSGEGVFRLLMRKRRTGDESKKFYLSFYRPPEVFEENNEYQQTESPEVEVETESKLGQEVLKLWNDHLEKDVPYGSLLGQALDPANYLRMTVRLGWEKNELDESIMVLKEVIGISWFGKRIQELHQKAADESNAPLDEETPS